jgi:uncharacterized membrane protein YdbT with pleckstrin-like domain
MSFATQQLLPGEKLIILARQHPLVLSRPILLNLAALVLLAGLYYFLQNVWFLALYLIPLIYFIWKYLDWQKREYILTDRRVVKQEGVLSISSFDAPLDKINNVFHNQSLMGRLFKYGSVGLETASEMGTTVFDFLSKPLDFKNCIVRQRELYGADLNPMNSNLQPSIPKLIEDLASLRDRNLITKAEFEDKKKALLEKL